jgi:hypothetical protein
MAEGGNGVARWGAWASAVGTAAVILGAMFVLYSQVSTAYAKANDLEGRVDRLSNVIEEQRIEIAGLKSSQIEQDTQLRASIDDSNKSLAWQLRINAMLWEKTFKGSHLPTDNAFYPNIANGNSR